MFEGPLSAGPLSDAAVMSGPLSLRIARVSREAGPGYRISRGANVTVMVDNLAEAPYEVVRLSPVAIWFIAVDYVKYQRGATLCVRLMGEDGEIGPLDAKVVSVEPSEEGSDMLVGLQVPVISLALGRRVLGLLRSLVARGAAEPARSLSMTQEHIDDNDRIRSILTALVSAGGDGILRGLDTPVRVTRVEPEGSGKIYWRAPEAWGEPPFLIDMVGFSSIQRIHIPSQEVKDGEVVTPLPTHIERVRHRWFRRVMVRSNLTLKYAHPLWSDMPVVERKVRDISFAGIGFETNPEEDLGFPGLELPEIIVTPERGEPVRLRGQMRFVSLGKNGAPSLCGMRVTPATADEESRWRNLIASEMHETTANGLELVEPIWTLFEQSGYFSLSGKTPAQFEQLKQSFFALGHRASKAPSLFCQVVWPSGRGVEASGSLVKAYHGTWLSHQLAKRAGRAPGNIDPRQILRDIYVRGFEHPQADPDFRWAVAYLEAQVAWSKKAHLEFAARYDGMGLTLVLPFRLREGASSEKTESALSLAVDDLRIGPATYEEQERLIGIIQATRSPVYVDALDFVPDRFNLDLIAKQWREAGIERAREVLIARRGSVPIAAAVVESGETGSNLFRLLDAVRLFPMYSGGESAYLALLDAARDWYAAHGKPTFTYFDESFDDALAERAKLRDLGDGNFWAISALLLPEFLEHIYELTASRPRK